jgi:tetratricopeptide (TPR) repeat protein
VEVAKAPEQKPAETAPVLPDDYDGLLRLARRAYRGNNTTKAKALVQQALAKNPDGVAAMVLFGNCRLDDGSTTDAMSWADKALAADGRYADAWLLKGAVLQQKEKLKEARGAYEKYLQFAPKGEYADEVRTILEGMTK